MPENVTRLGVFSEDNYRDLVIALLADGAAQDLTGISTHQVRLRNLKTGATIVSATSAVDGAATLGKIRHVWASPQLTNAGPDAFEYLVRVKVTFANGKVQTFPAPGEPELRVKIVPVDT
jgi:hypothetical protein